MDFTYHGNNQRLDAVLVARAGHLATRSTLSKLIKDGYVQVDGQPVRKAGAIVRDGAVLLIDISPLQTPSSVDRAPTIIYEDNDVLVLNKPAGMLTHSKGAYNAEVSVASYVREHCPDMPSHFNGDGDNNRLGIVHRLDRGTSGVIIVAKHQKALDYLQRQFAERKAEKVYVALVSGRLKPDTARIDMPIARNPRHPSTYMTASNGRTAQTDYVCLESCRAFTLVELRPKTGRTHQIRVHLRALRHPIVGDHIYGGEPADRLYLHARSLTITLPTGNRKTFEAPVPDSFICKLEAAEKK